MKKVFTFFICTLVTLLPFSVLADGGMISLNYEQDIYEPRQIALIVHDQGMEDLYLKVNYEGNTNKFVWIIPTPTMPEANRAPEDIFEELSTLTTAVEPRWKNPDKVTGLVVPETQGIIVHSQEQIGVYSITVLSATKDDNLYDWLSNNGYFVPKEIKDLLDWYVGKEWYFTAVKVDPEGIIVKAVEDLKEIDPLVTKENFSEKLAELLASSFRNHDYVLFSQIWPITLDVVGAIESTEEFAEISQEQFNQLIIVQGMDDYTEAEWQEEKNEAKKSIDDVLEQLTPKAVGKYSNYLKPIKLSFSSESIVYPFKISQISTRVPENPRQSPKTNEVLIYILADRQVKAPSFALEYHQEVTPVILDEKEKFTSDLNSLQEIITKEYFLTKLRRTFAKEEMDQDIYFINVSPWERYYTLGDSQLRKLSASYAQDSRYQQQIKQVRGMAILDRLRGRIILRVEANGEAYYINPKTRVRRYLGRAADAYNIMREEGVGITNSDLAKIPVALSEIAGPDSDGDGLADTLEVGLGTNPNSIDSDGDGYDDKTEITRNYNPNGQGWLPINNSFARQHGGKIFLQVQGHGEAWYVNPVNGKRYYLGQPADAYSIMRNLGLGISESDFNTL